MVVSTPTGFFTRPIDPLLRADNPPKSRVIDVNRHIRRRVLSCPAVANGVPTKTTAHCGSIVGLGGAL